MEKQINNLPILAAKPLTTSKGRIMKLEVAMLVGAESKAFLATLTEQIDRLEKLTAGITKTPTKKTAPVEDEDVEEQETDEDEDEEFTTPKKKATKKAAASFDDEEDVEEESEEVEEAPKTKKKAAKKVTLDLVNDACKARAADTGGKEGRTEVLGILKKKFKVTSVSELKPEQYSAVIEAMAI